MEKYRKCYFYLLFTSHGIALDCRVWVPRKFYFYSLDNVHEIETEVFQLHDTFMLSAAWWTQFISSAIKISRDDFTINDSPSSSFSTLSVWRMVWGVELSFWESSSVFLCFLNANKKAQNGWVKCEMSFQVLSTRMDKKVRKGMIAVPFCCWWCVYGK